MAPPAVATNDTEKHWGRTDLLFALLPSPMGIKHLPLQQSPLPPQDVAPSVAPDGAVITELRSWNATYGEGGERARFANPKLSYFM